tara:strand:- start:1659 stop:1868 length:210 start_codon:yes stop_codon:yes gene_type:complete
MENVIEDLDRLDFSNPLSLKTIRNRTRVNGKMVNKKLMLATLHTFERYSKVTPLEVGSGKHRLNIWNRV